MLSTRRLAGEDLFALLFLTESRRVKVNRRRLWISIAIELRTNIDDEGEGWRTHVLKYAFSVFGDERGTTEWLAYHFHPRGGSAEPHLHVNASPEWARKGLRKQHLVTGRAPVEGFVEMLITEFGAVPLKTNWKRELTRTRATFDVRRTW